MKDVDFKECRLIDALMCYLTYDEFCENRKFILKYFEELSTDGKLFYKFYVYANIHMEVKYKDIIWNYLNVPCPDTENELTKYNKPSVNKL